MKQLTANVFVETKLKGANHGIVATSDGIVLIDTPHKPSDAMRLKGEIGRRGQLRYIINTEPHGDHWTGNAFFDVPVVAQQGVRTRILGTDLAAHCARVGSFGPDEPALLENYKANVPVITFDSEMTLHVGNHTFRMIHMPGHTPYQAAVIVEEEGVVFTSDNILQSADLAPRGQSGSLVEGARILARSSRGHICSGSRAGVQQALLGRTGLVRSRVGRLCARRHRARNE